jgi:hypothetical protein
MMDTPSDKPEGLVYPSPGFPEPGDSTPKNVPNPNGVVSARGAFTRSNALPAEAMKTQPIQGWRGVGTFEPGVRGTPGL